MSARRSLPPRAPGRASPLVTAAVALLALVSYSDAFDLGFTHDDHVVIERNEVVTRPDVYSLGDVFRTPYWGTAAPPGASRGYRPVTALTFRLERALWGPGPFGPHAVNVLLHLAVTLLVASLLRALLAREEGSRAALVPPLAAALFAVHPAHTEAVASLVGRGELLAALGVLGATWLLLRASDDPAREGFASADARGGRVALVLGAAMAYAVGVFSKESAAVAPLYALVALVWRARRAGTPWRTAAGSAALLVSPMALVLATFLALRAWVVREAIPHTHVSLLDNALLGHGALARVATALALQARYLALMVWPWSLSADYGHRAISVVTSPWSGWLLAGLALASLALWRARRGGVVALGVALWCVAFLPTANALFPIHVLFAERLLYFPSVGACLVAAWGVARAFEAGGARAKALPWAVAVVLVALAGRTLARNRDWVDDVALFESARRVTPGSARVRNNYGAALLSRGERAAARDEFLAAVAIYPRYPDAWVNLGVAELSLGRPREALSALTRAQSLSPAHPALEAPLREARARVAGTR